MSKDMGFVVGDMVTRRPVNNFDKSGMKGTVVAAFDNRVKIKWDEKQNTGQQHSTIQSKFLIKIPNNE